MKAQIRASEDVLSLIRQMQELWLFGQLNTLSQTNLDNKADERATEVASLLQKLIEARSLETKTI